MITDQELAEIAALESPEGIVSLYVGIEPTLLQDPNAAHAKARSAWKRFERTETNPKWREAAEREKERILEFLDRRTPEGRGIAIFACEPAGIWKDLTLHLPVPTLLQVDSTTRTGILAAIHDEFPRFAAVLVQRDRAAIYVSGQGEREALERIESEVPGQHAQGGWAQARFQRHVEFHVSAHMREVVEALEDLQRKLPFSYLMLGGTSETTAALEKKLPEPLRALVNGTFSVDVKHVSDEEVVEQALALRERTEREEERKLVDSILDAAASGGPGAVGARDTFRAILEGRARTIALLDDFVVDGAECTRCDYFDTPAFETCPLCGAPGERISNIAERAMEKAYLAGAKVDFVFQEAREKLAERGGIGALLRY